MKLITKPAFRPLANGKWGAFIGSEKIAEADTKAAVQALVSNRYRVDGSN